MTDRRHFDDALVMFCLENCREKIVVAEYVGAESLPSPHRPATERSLRKPPRVTDGRHFELQ
jgi:hypothetical protein